MLTLGVSAQTNRNVFTKLIYADTASYATVDVSYSGVIQFPDNVLVQGILLWQADTISTTDDGASIQREVYVSTDGKQYFPLVGHRDTVIYTGLSIPYESRTTTISEQPIKYLKPVVTLIDSVQSLLIRVDGHFITRKP